MLNSGENVVAVHKLGETHLWNRRSALKRPVLLLLRYTRAAYAEE